MLAAFRMPPGPGPSVSGSEPKFPGGEPGALQPGEDLGERGLAAGGGVIAERGEAAVIAGAEPARFDVGGGFQDPVPDLSGGLHLRVDRVDDAHEDALPRPGVFGDRAEYPGAVRLAGQLDVEGAGVQAEQAGQQSGVV